MLREEAEREAERRNLEDPERGRYEFYAFDESAGMPEDAWDVARRLRQGPPPATEWPGVGPQTPAAGAPEPPASAPEPPPKREEPPAERDDEHLWLGGPTVAETDPFAGPDPFVEPLPQEEPGEWVEEEPRERRSRGTTFVKVFGAIVIVVAMLWMALIVYLAVALKPDSTASLGVFIGGVVCGLVAILLGVTIRRS